MHAYMHAAHTKDESDSNAEGIVTCQLTLILSTAGTEYVGIAMYNDRMEERGAKIVLSTEEVQEREFTRNRYMF